MDMTKEALQHLQDSAVAFSGVTVGQHAGMVLPSGYSIVRTEDFNKHRDRFRAKFNTQRIDDFVAYYLSAVSSVSQEGKAKVFVNQDMMSATAIFDIGTIDKPLHCEHSAKVELSITPEYEGVFAVLGERLGQQDIAEFIEDYRSIIMLGDAAGEEIPVKKGIVSFRNITIDSNKKSESEVKSFSVVKSEMESIEAKSAGNEIPAFIVFNVALYNDLNVYQVKCRISMTTRNEPLFTIRPINLEKVIEACADEFVSKIKDRMTDGEFFIGTYDPK